MPSSVTSFRSLLAALLLLPFTGCGESTRPSLDDLQLDLAPVVSGLTSPVYLTAPVGDARLFVVEQPGRIRIVKDGQLLTTPFLDISSRVLSGGERGLLSMAFSPQYATNGFFFVYFTSPPNGDIVVERYGGAVGADVANATPTPVITIPHPGASNHNGGLLTFGPDAMLYMGTGDGGGGGDPNGNGQNQNVLLGKLLRLDVRTLPYIIPTTNPFAGQAGKRGEIWAYGLRNPWRYAFDRVAAAPTLYIADVGQDRYEEVNVVAASTAGINYGWNVMEGTHCYPSGNTCNKTGLQLPVLEYDHGAGSCSITGGFVYRGTAIPEATGQYFYSDYCTGFIASMSGSIGSGFTSRTWTVPAVGNVLSFGEDSAGELYVLSANGTVYKIVRR
jgi:glucose/arabinose dehydrogenase